MSIQARGGWILRGPRCRGGRRNLVAPAGLGAGGEQWGHAEPGGGGAAAQTHGLGPAC